MTKLAPTLQAFFTDRLIRERNASPNTIAAYRDTIRLLLIFASDRLKTEPSQLQIEQLDAPLIGAFLDHLERDRGCRPRTRNSRLTAIRSLDRYASRLHPEHAATIERVLAISPKRYERPIITWLTEPEIDALINAPDPSTWTGRRDRAMLMLAAQTGLRASELLSLAPTEPRRARAASRRACRDCCSILPVADERASHAACAAPQRRDAAPECRR